LEDWDSSLKSLLKQKEGSTKEGRKGEKESRTESKKSKAEKSREWVSERNTGRKE
jgi:hypothetical protein